MLVDPRDSKNHRRTLWCVYGPDCFPTVFACQIIPHGDGAAIWGYSVYRGKPGFRTLGRELSGGWIEENDARFFDNQQEALNYLLLLTRPEAP